jgi:hypothetical protein
MADLKISQLDPATTPLAGTEVLPIVQSSSTKKVATNDLTVKNVRSNATTGILQVAGPGASTTRVMTTPDANFTAARTDAAQTFTGTQTLGNVASGVEAKLSARPTQISVSTSATTIVTDAGPFGTLIIVNGNFSGNRFCDIVIASTGASPFLLSGFTSLGSPDSRTYTRSGSALQLAMGANTYSVSAISIGY